MGEGERSGQEMDDPQTKGARSRNARSGRWRSGGRYGRAITGYPPWKGRKRENLGKLQTLYVYSNNEQEPGKEHISHGAIRVEGEILEEMEKQSKRDKTFRIRRWRKKWKHDWKI